MPYARFEKPAQDSDGNLLENIWCRVQREDVGSLPLEPLFSDRLGNVPLSNPFMTPSGIPAFHCAGGAFAVRYYKAGFDETYHYVGVGLGSENDLQGFVPMGVWDDITSYTIGDVVTYDSGGDLFLFASKINDNLNNEPDGTPQDSAFWVYIGGAIEGPQGPAGTSLDFDGQSDDIAGRAVYNAQPAGFSVLVSDVGDGRAAIYVMGSGGSGDWSAPAYIAPPPPDVTPADGSITNAKLANVATATIKGRVTAGSGSPEDLSASQARTVLGIATSDSPQFAGLNVGAATDTTITRDSAGVIAVEGVPLFSNIPQNSKSAAYTLVLSDAQKHIFHPAADTTARIWTIPANSSVAFPIGTAITFINENAGGVLTISITTDTMRLAGAGTTGNRTLAANGVATAIKVTSTSWIISGTGLT